MHTQAMLFIQDLAVIMLLAGLSSIICYRIKQPIVLGYILVGVILSQHTPPFGFIYDEKIINTLAELGVIFLMFSLGLEFNLHKLSEVGKTAVITASLEIILMVWLGYEIGSFFGWSHINSIFLGALLSISSTTIIVKALHELKMKKEPFAQVIFGILIVEDIFAILILALLSSLALTGELHIPEVITTTIKLTSFLIVSLIIGILLVPRLLAHIAKFKSNEVLLITVLGLCFGFCLLVEKLNYSVALGAFVMGAIIAESKQLTKIEYLINPLRDMFSAIFFVSVGLLFDPMIFIDYFYPIVIITGAVIVGKVLSCSLGVAITGRGAKTSMQVGMGLAQIGEFSFIIASLGVSLHVTGDFLYSIAVCVSIITTLTTPYLIKYSDTVTQCISKLMPTTISSAFHIYTKWIQSIQTSEDQQVLGKSIKRGIIHVIVNVYIVIAIYFCGIFIAQTNLINSLFYMPNIYWQKTIIWSIALIASLPFLIASYLQIKSISVTLAELSMNECADEKLTIKVRKIISEAVPTVAILMIMILIAILSASILPPIELLLLILIIVAVLLVFVLPTLMKIHARLQSSLMETIKKNEDHN